MAFRWSTTGSRVPQAIEKKSGTKRLWDPWELLAELVCKQSGRAEERKGGKGAREWVRNGRRPADAFGTQRLCPAGSFGVQRPCFGEDGLRNTRRSITGSAVRVNYFIGTVRMNCGKIAEIPTRTPHVWVGQPNSFPGFGILRFSARFLSSFSDGTYEIARPSGRHDDKQREQN